jgi:serine/threonine protein phosphatase PrpC
MLFLPSVCFLFLFLFFLFLVLAFVDFVQFRRRQRIQLFDMSDPSAHDTDMASASSNSSTSSSSAAAAADANTTTVPADSKFSATVAGNEKHSGFVVDVFGNARKGAKQWQEDAFFIFRSPTRRTVVAGIFDGHGGYNGLVASSTAKNFWIAHLEENKDVIDEWDDDEWKEKLPTLFSDTHTAIRNKFLSKADSNRYADDHGIVRAPAGDPIHGGTTASVSVVRLAADGSSSLITANVGDSAGILVKPDSSYNFVTVDHGPENPVEYNRVQEMDAKDHPIKLLFVYDKTNVFRKYECPLVFLPDGVRDPKFVQNPWGNGLHPTNVRYEPAVYAVTPRSVSKDTTCIAMTRALGDFYAHQFGLTYVPDVTVQKLPADESTFLLAVASDGIWDCWKYEDFAKYLNDQLKKNIKVDSLVEYTLSESIRRAVANFGAKHYDDASLVCVRVARLQE